jgi:hypothetical protein
VVRDQLRHRRADAGHPGNASLHGALGVVEQDDAKTLSSARELDLPPHLAPILRRVRREQWEMRLAAGDKWEGPADGYVVAHSFGRPVSRRALNTWWNRSLEFAGVRGDVAVAQGAGDRPDRGGGRRPTEGEPVTGLLAAADRAAAVDPARPAAADPGGVGGPDHR